MTAWRAWTRAGRGLATLLAVLGEVRIAPPRSPRVAARRLSVAFDRFARAHDLEVQVHGELPRGQALIVANHVSYLDPIAILARCPAIPIAKAEVAGWPLFGPIARGSGVVFVERDDPWRRIASLRRVHALLAGGVSVLSFPEGTTTAGRDVAAFWRGTFGIAARLGVPVVPVAVRYPDAALAWIGDDRFLPHYARTVRRRRLDLAIAFGRPVEPRPAERPEAMAARARAAIRCMLETLQEIHAGPRARVSRPRPDPVLPTADLGGAG